jgi:hypothetical protein
MTCPCMEIGQFLTTEVHTTVFPTGVATARSTSNHSDIKLQSREKEYDTNECVAPESKSTVAWWGEIKSVPVTTSFDAAATPGSRHIHVQAQYSVVPLGDSDWLDCWQGPCNP